MAGRVTAEGLDAWARCARIRLVRVCRAGAGPSAGAAAAAALIAGFGWAATPQARPLPRPAFSLRENKQHLSSAELAAFARWGGRVRRCATTRGVELDEPTIGRNEIVITVRGGDKITPREHRRVLACAIDLGDPPRFATFARFASDGYLHIYKPRACLLPPVPEEPA